LQSVFGVRHVPDIGYNMYVNPASFACWFETYLTRPFWLCRYKRNYAEPQLDEGFTEIKPINFVPQFDDPEHERLFKNRT
jgi:hypothetical protein